MSTVTTVILLVVRADFAWGWNWRAFWLACAGAASMEVMRWQRLYRGNYAVRPWFFVVSVVLVAFAGTIATALLQADGVVASFYVGASIPLVLGVLVGESVDGGYGSEVGQDPVRELDPPAEAREGMHVRLRVVRVLNYLRLLSGGR